MTATLTPTATGTFVVKPGQFVIRIGSSTTAAAYTCTVATPATPASATPPLLTVGVASASASPSDTGTPTPTPTATPTRTPKPTHTVYTTVTNTPKSTQQVTKKPVSGAATGGGGDAGPDGRLFVLVGTILVGGAGVGGLLMRRRRPQRG